MSPLRAVVGTDRGTFRDNMAVGVRGRCGGEGLVGGAGGSRCGGTGGAGVRGWERGVEGGQQGRGRPGFKLGKGIRGSNREVG